MKNDPLCPIVLLVLQPISVFIFITTILLFTSSSLSAQTPDWREWVKQQQSSQDAAVYDFLRKKHSYEWCKNELAKAQYEYELADRLYQSGKDLAFRGDISRYDSVAVTYYKAASKQFTSVLDWRNSAARRVNEVEYLFKQGFCK